ncbi:MAG: hypothetical protein ACRCVT_09205, partial [Leadbetterella sp.]
KGDTRTIQFQSPSPGKGYLILEIAKVESNQIIFKIQKDDTPMSKWLTWKQIKIRIRPISKDKKEVTWSSEYTCDLGPHWYFDPIEKYAVNKMNQHLLDTYFK